MTEHKAPRPSSKTAGDIQQVRVARLTKAHGLKGAIKLELYTDDPERRFTPGASFTLQVPTSSPWHGKLLTLTELKFYNSHPVAFFEGVDDRTAAEGLIKAILWVDQDPTELPAEKDAWYDYQLVGLRALRDDVEVGKVVRVDHFPAQDLLVIDTGDREVLVPFVAAIVPAVDITAGTVTVTPPTGLFEDLVDDDPEPPPVGPASAARATSNSGSESDPDEPADPATPAVGPVAPAAD